MIDRNTADKIKDAADIVDVVSDYVHLIRRGANYVGLCPFHNERTPSFSVNRSRNFCYCFSCHKGGSPVNFIMEKEGVSYHDALLILAKKYGIEVQERELSPEERDARNERESMMVANEWAAKQMSQWLTETPDGRDIGLSYLYGRGITAEAVEKFRLGYSLDRSTALTEAARSSGFDINVMTALGLTGKSQEGRYYDRFRGRVIFPIMNASGRVIAFGGRDLKGGPAKYVNSPESSLYKKSNELYGIFQAKAEIVRQDKCFLVEGYLDVIGMWQAGLQNVVASSGTALTDGQIALIHRFTGKITLIYDGDAAGIKASLRGIDMLLKHRMEVKVVLLPGGHDPDSFAREQGADNFRKYIDENETDIIRFQTKVLLDEAGNDPQRRIAAANSVVRSISAIPDHITRSVYIQESARIFGIDETSIAKAVALAIEENERQYAKQKEVERRRMATQSQPSPSQQSSGQQIQPAEPSRGENPSDSERQSADASEVLSAVGTAPTISVQEKRRPILEKIERSLVSHCVRIGFLPFCEIGEPDSPDARVVNVVEYIADDLRTDGLDFTNDIYRNIVDCLLSSKQQLDNALDRYAHQVEEELMDFRKQRIDEIASSSISMQGIAIAEKKMEQEIVELRDRKIREFMRDFSSRILASHEDDRIRRTATELLYDKNQLSRIFTKEIKPSDLERAQREMEDTAITRNLAELKNEIINQQYLTKLEEFKTEVAAGADASKIAALQADIVKLTELRQELARILGERVFTPGKK